MGRAKILCGAHAASDVTYCYEASWSMKPLPRISPLFTPRPVCVMVEHINRGPMPLRPRRGRRLVFSTPCGQSLEASPMRRGSSRALPRGAGQSIELRICTWCRHVALSFPSPWLAPLVPSRVSVKTVCQTTHCGSPGALHVRKVAIVTHISQSPQPSRSHCFSTQIRKVRKDLRSAWRPSKACKST